MHSSKNAHSSLFLSFTCLQLLTVRFYLSPVALIKTTTCEQKDTRHIHFKPSARQLSGLCFPCCFVRPQVMHQLCSYIRKLNISESLIYYSWQDRGHFHQYLVLSRLLSCVGLLWSSLTERSQKQSTLCTYKRT